MRLITIYTVLSPDNNELTRSNKADCKLQQLFFIRSIFVQAMILIHVIRLHLSSLVLTNNMCLIEIDEITFLNP